MQKDSLAINLIDHIAEKLSVPTSHILAIIQHQLPVDIFRASFIFAFMLLASVFLSWVVWKNNKEDYEEGVVVIGIVTVISIIFTIVSLYDLSTLLITAHYNPEYYAIQKILDALTGK